MYWQLKFKTIEIKNLKCEMVFFGCILSINGGIEVLTAIILVRWNLNLLILLQKKA